MRYSATCTASRLKYNLILCKFQQASKDADNKIVPVEDQDSVSMSVATRETRANSAPDLQCSVPTIKNDQNGSNVWSVDTNNDGPPASCCSSTRTTVNHIVSSDMCNPTTVSSVTKARTKSYATTQDGSRLSYCEVATGIDSVSSKSEEDVLVGIMLPYRFFFKIEKGSTELC